MKRAIQGLGILLAVGLVGYAAMLLLANPDADQAVDDVILDADDDAIAYEQAEDARARLQLAARGLAEDPDGRRRPGSSQVSTVPYGSGEVDAPSARAGFRYIMEEVEGIADSRQRLNQEQWDDLYRQANDAFSALSMVLDAHNDAQRLELEQAHKRLQQGLERVRVRGRKFGP